jgi:DNA modification methylase/endonuclease YncB( thermonuclease family)
MTETKEAAVDLVVTSPPYWHIKDYGVPGQIGYGQPLHDYLRDLYRVWTECHRVLRDGARLCINIGDQFARAAVYGRYKVIPIHAEFIAQCETIGFDFMGSIIWQKKTTMNTTGGATVMGSFPYPPNGIVEIDYEFIHILKKPGQSKRVSRSTKEASKLSTGEWKEYFSGHWTFGGIRQTGHEAMFPDELPRRLIRMFTFKGDTVLDPFLGSGTTMRVAHELDRNAIGYEVNEAFLALIKDKIGVGKDSPGRCQDIEIIKKAGKPRQPSKIDYTPRIRDAQPAQDPKAFDQKAERLYRVVEIVDETTLRVDSGHLVRLLGLKVKKRREALEYLKTRILKKQVYLKPEPSGTSGTDPIAAYVYLKNRIFVNAYLIKSGLCKPDPDVNHELRNRFADLVETSKART